MNTRSLYAAGALVLLANGLALIHAARNRAGAPDADVILTNRELAVANNDQENSGVQLRLNWLVIPSGVHDYGTFSPDWLDRKKLSELGFDCSVDPTAPASERFYMRPRPRAAFAALEYDGQASRDWQARRAEDARRPNPALNTPAYRNDSRLVLIDAATDPVELRRHHPDRHSVIILPAVVRLSRAWPVPPSKQTPAVPARLTGYVELSTTIHVPRPYSERLPGGRGPYRVGLHFGSLCDPWVTDVWPEPK